MRDFGLPKLLTWRWTPFAALVLGSLSFVGFALLVIPDRIGSLAREGAAAASLGFGNQLATNQSGPGPASNWSRANNNSDNAAAPATNAFSRVATQVADSFPKRGFSPPLEREAPPPPPPQPEAPPPPPPAPPPPEATPPPPPPAPETPAPPPDAAVNQPPTGTVLPQNN